LAVALAAAAGLLEMSSLSDDADDDEEFAA
jgi:hypothetical protein